MSAPDAIDNEWLATDMGLRVRALVDLADDPLAVADAINKASGEEVDALLLCTVLILADVEAGR